MILILVLVVLSGLAVGFKTIEVGNFRRGGEDTLLGLTLGLDLQGGSHLVYQAELVEDPSGGMTAQPTTDQMASLKSIIERRLNSAGLGEPVVQVLGDDRLLIQIPGVSDPDNAKALIGETAQLEFKHRMLNVPRRIEFQEGEIVGYRVVEVTPELIDPSPTEGEESADGAADDATDDDMATDDGADSAADDATDDDTATDDGTDGAADDATDDDTATDDGGDSAADDATDDDTATDDGGDSAADDATDDDTATDDGTDGAADDATDDDTATDDGADSAGDDATDDDTATDDVAESAGDDATDDDAATDDGADGAAQSDASGEEDAPPGPPGLEIEFSDAGFVKFAEVVNGMQNSMTPPAGTTDIYPDRLVLSLEGSTAQELDILYQQVLIGPGGEVISLEGTPSIQQIVGTNKYVVNLGTALLDGDDLMAAAQEQFPSGGELVVTVVAGKVDEDINLTGNDLARAYPGQHQGSGIPIVNIEFNAEGTRKFGQITGEIAQTGDQLAIILDDRELIAPVADRAITGGSAYISGGDFTIERVQQIALLLESGRLPIPISLIQERNIDAILGSDSLQKSVRAGVVGLALVFLFMILYYRMPGIIAGAALLIYTLMLIAVFKMIPVTLTLSGVAAAILSIGMAVDANILIFERMKEEMRAGRPLFSSINIGFNRAWSAIRDSNVSTLITSGILYWFADTLGATIVQGFAATLAIGVLLSMFSSIVISRTLLRIVALSRIGRRLRWFVPTEGKSLPQLQLESQGS